MQCLTPHPKEYLVPIPESDYTDHITYTTYIAVRSIHGHRGGTGCTVCPMMLTMMPEAHPSA